MAGDIKYYNYKRQEIMVRGLCDNGTLIRTYLSDYDFKRLLCENRREPEKECFELVLGKDNAVDSEDLSPACLPCVLNLIEIGFNRSMIRHESRYASRQGARKKLQYVRLL